jgi:hypothetical protein
MSVEIISEGNYFEKLQDEDFIKYVKRKKNQKRDFGNLFSFFVTISSLLTLGSLFVLYVTEIVIAVDSVVSLFQKDTRYIDMPSNFLKILNFL